MWHSVTRWVVPSISKDHSTIVFKSRAVQEELFFNYLTHGDVCFTVLQNVGSCSPSDTPSHTRILKFSATLMRKSEVLHLLVNVKCFCCYWQLYFLHNCPVSERNCQCLAGASHTVSIPGPNKHINHFCFLTVSLWAAFAYNFSAGKHVTIWGIYMSDSDN